LVSFKESTDKEKPFLRVCLITAGEFSDGSPLKLLLLKEKPQKAVLKKGLQYAERLAYD
jgi:hypothetical protein